MTQPSLEFVKLSDRQFLWALATSFTGKNANGIVDARQLYSIFDYWTEPIEQINLVKCLRELCLAIDPTLEVPSNPLANTTANTTTTLNTEINEKVKATIALSWPRIFELWCVTHPDMFYFIPTDSFLQIPRLENLCENVQYFFKKKSSRLFWLIHAPEVDQLAKQLYQDFFCWCTANNFDCSNSLLRIKPTILTEWLASPANYNDVFTIAENFYASFLKYTSHCFKIPPPVLLSELVDWNTNRIDCYTLNHLRSYSKFISADWTHDVQQLQKNIKFPTEQTFVKLYFDTENFRQQILPAVVKDKYVENLPSFTFPLYNEQQITNHAWYNFPNIFICEKLKLPTRPHSIKFKQCIESSFPVEDSECLLSPIIEQQEQQKQEQKQKVFIPVDLIRTNIYFKLGLITSGNFIDWRTNLTTIEDCLNPTNSFHFDIFDSIIINTDSYVYNNLQYYYFTSYQYNPRFCCQGELKSNLTLYDFSLNLQYAKFKLVDVNQRLWKEMVYLSITKKFLNKLKYLENIRDRFVSLEYKPTSNNRSDFSQYWINTTILFRNINFRPIYLEHGIFGAETQSHFHFMLSNENIINNLFRFTLKSNLEHECILEFVIK